MNACTKVPLSAWSLKLSYHELSGQWYALIDKAGQSSVSINLTEFKDEIEGIKALIGQANGMAGTDANNKLKPEHAIAQFTPEEAADEPERLALTVSAAEVGKRLVFQQDNDQAYLAIATGSGADKWTNFPLSPAATEALLGVVRKATLTEALAGDSDAGAMTPLKTRKALEDWANPRILARAPLPALSDAALGTIRPVATGGYTRVMRGFELQADAGIFGTQRGVAHNFSSVEERFGVFGDHIRYYLYSTGVADFTYAEWRDVVPLFLGQLHTFTLVNPQDGSAPTLNVDGVELPAPGVVSSASPVAWDEPLTATYLSVGKSWIVSEKVKRISDFVALNQALSEQEIARRLATGVLVKADERGAGTTVYDWSGGLGSQGWGKWGGPTITPYDTATDPDGIGLPPNAMATILKVVTSTAGNGIVEGGLLFDRDIAYNIALYHPASESGSLSFQASGAMATSTSVIIEQGAWWHNEAAVFRRNVGDTGRPLIFLQNAAGTFYVALQMPSIHPEVEPAAIPAGSPTVASREPFTHHDRFVNNSGLAQNFALTDQSANSIIDSIVVDVVSGSATYAIGTTSGGGQVAATQAGGRLTLTSDIFADTQRGLHLATSGDCEVVVSVTLHAR